ncbi:MAG TPA: alpha/beta hydrolase [Longimicrobiaceae bacterium]|nr:alpha/beta hydrolase [Longimicrobiaceae bacterium]
MGGRRAACGRLTYDVIAVDVLEANGSETMMLHDFGRTRVAALAACATLGVGACAHPAPTARGPVTWDEVAALPVPAPDHRIAYGADPLQFGELRLPEGPGPHPVAVFIHGGCWRSQFDVRHVASASAALARAGVAVWTLEYRRIGDPGGGWPGTFQDVARGTDHLRELARRYPLDLDRVVLVGHSAGGHLALWLAARRNVPSSSPLVSGDPLPVRGVVPLAGITDLRAYGAAPGSCNAAVPLLLGGSPAEVPDRYAQASPAELLPLGVPQRLLHGALDAIVPVEQSREFAERASARGDDARLVLVEGAGHFDLVAPFSPAWARVEEAVRSLLAPR